MRSAALVGPTLALVLSAFVPALSLGAQADPPPVMDGRLYIAEAAADSGTVVLHRVTPEEAGPVDSVRVEAGGRFRLPLPGTPVPGSGEVFFASVRYEGILYYGDAVTAPEQLEEPYAIRAYPTRRAPPGGLPLPIAVRNVFVDHGALGWELTDLLEIRNDSSVTFVPGAQGEPVWRYPLPTGARGARAGRTDAGPQGIRFREGAVEVTGPIPPGGRLVVIQYDMEEMEFSLPAPGRTGVLEVLVREPAPALHLEGLARQPSVELEEGSTYLRWAGEDLEDRAVRVREGEPGGELVAGWVIVVLALILALVAIWAVVIREGSPAEGSAAPEGGDAPGAPPPEKGP